MKVWFFTQLSIFPYSPSDYSLQLASASHMFCRLFSVCPSPYQLDLPPDLLPELIHAAGAKVGLLDLKIISAAGRLRNRLETAYVRRGTNASGLGL